MRNLISTALPLIFLSSAAVAANPFGCPAPNSPGKVWHIDAMNGLDAAHGGDGSAAKPWSSLKAVTTLQPGYKKVLLAGAPYDHYPKNSPVTGVRYGPDGTGYDTTQIQPGDTVLLATGAYGSVGFGNWNVDASGATSWVTFAPELNAAPVISTLGVAGARGLVFSGLTFRATLDDGSASNSGDIIKVSAGATAATATRDIVFDGNFVGSASSMPTWTKAEWLAKARTGVIVTGPPSGDLTQCVSVINNSIRFVNVGASVSQATNTTFANNLVDYFAGDGIDSYSASFVMIDGNKIWDRVDDGNGTHADGTQLAFNSSTHSTLAKPWHDITITNNEYIRLAHADNPFPGYLQGIFHTNDLYDRVTITNNKVVTAACTGIALTATNSVVANNTVVRDGTPSSLTPGCAGLNISVRSQGGGPTLVANNVVTGGYTADLPAQGVTWKNNLAVPTMSGGVAVAGGSSYLPVNGKMTFVGVGVYGGVTVLSLKDASTLFIDYDPPITGLNSEASPNLTAAAGGLLDGTGYPMQKINIGAN